ncbi:ras-gef domain-containing family member 1b-b [Plakobranchus ocellatus]|uniref:Ras-gef domain-containing family member 1b-b n=1 Tax=Plakobranchus ocellatus TaxID=259542 RepID=A0AAV4CA80_9GAST|nr:ras-gef domain-containing family member 1b-b [Plakobranchus ocellatus]
MSLSSETSVSSLESSRSDTPSSVFSLEENALLAHFRENCDSIGTSSKGSQALLKLCRFNIFSKNYKISRNQESVTDDPRTVLGSSYTRRRCSYFYHRYNFHESPLLSEARNYATKAETPGREDRNDLDKIQVPLQPVQEQIREQSLRVQIQSQEPARERESTSTVIEYDDNEEEMILPEFNSVPLEVTVRLLEGERRRLVMFQRELAQCLSQRQPSKKHIGWLTQNIERVEKKYRSIEEEFRKGCMEALLRRLRLAKKSSRSQPAIGVKQTQKSRPTIFGTVAQRNQTSDNKQSVSSY